MRRRAAGALGLALLSSALASVCSADVRIESRTVSQGLMGFGDGTSTSVMTVAPDRCRSEDEFTYTGRFKTLAGKKPKKSATVVRLDKELMWMLDYEDKEYSELTFADMRAMMEKGIADAEAKSAEVKSAQAEGAGRAQDTNLKFTTQVKKSGEKQEINGFPCEHVIIEAIGKSDPPQPESLEVEIHIVLDQWLTRKVPGEKEVADYYRALPRRSGSTRACRGSRRSRARCTARASMTWRASSRTSRARPSARPSRSRDLPRLPSRSRPASRRSPT